ncbi:ferrochelatase [Pseudobacteriovorax antillogorgiicola]|uniref:Ferrochelatase n=1 Tax=Pseudobacteriovorax antillogorgiicola TaxID=1513793 RepID=A0A1Y6C7M5_9BACT|nr:ferrochelatase [Pseudobacteriovorax antillogorgiicola]TCS51697.1 ferrochelatase [Pseudobacteriovorax antillogorgiicola]SMF49177.1 ferrochelatase [Pseudobacteriovorax antillogorgiicola]
MERKIGLLLVNLGTPDSTEVRDVRRYLREFLMDPKVINLPVVFRAMLVYGIILPFRPKKSAAAYKEVWTPEGSPLLVHGQDLKTKLIPQLGDEICVELAMRYGNPSLEKGIESLLSQGVERIVVFPLYPQYAAATTGSTVEKVFDILAKRWNVPPVTIASDYFDHPLFIDAFAKVAKPQIDEFKPDHVLLSYHGLPESHVANTDEGPCSYLKGGNCCDMITAKNRYCYRAQCFATSRALAEALGLKADKHTVAFQSRLGRAEWIKPYTADKVKELADRGVKRLAVMCPAFVADCLETLEEIGMGIREDFKSYGGEDLRLVTSLNSEVVWVQAVTEICRGYFGPQSSSLEPQLSTSQVH